MAHHQAVVGALGRSDLGGLCHQRFHVAYMACNAPSVVVRAFRLVFRRVRSQTGDGRV